MRALEQALLRLLKHLALIMVTVIAAFVLLILLQFNTPDPTLLAAFIALTAAVIDFIGRRS